MTYFVLRHNYIIYLSKVVTFFDDVIVTLYFGKFQLRTEIMLQNNNSLVTLLQLTNLS